MSTWLFRFVEANGVVTEYNGIVTAKTKKELYWELDVHGNPYFAQIKPFKIGSVCFESIEKRTEIEISLHETSPHLYFQITEPTGWKWAFPKAYKHDY